MEQKYSECLQKHVHRNVKKPILYLYGLRIMLVKQWTVEKYNKEHVIVHYSNGVLDTSALKGEMVTTYWYPTSLLVLQFAYLYFDRERANTYFHAQPSAHSLQR